MSVYPSGKTLDAAEIVEGYRRHPIEDHGKLRYAYGKATAGVAVAANGTVGLCWLPSGRKRILLPLSYLSVSAFGAGRTLDIGHEAYQKGFAGPGASLEANDPDALIDGIDVSVAVAQRQFGVLAAAVPLKFDMYSTDEVLIYATVLGGTMPAAATLEVMIAYLYE